jgi:hypothetical protein
LILAETLFLALSICSVIDNILSAAKSPEPPLLQKIQPPVLMVPSRLGQDRPPERASLYILQPNFSFKYELREDIADKSPSVDELLRNAKKTMGSEIEVPKVVE